MKEKDVVLLNWIYARMMVVHKENENFDYMLTFKRFLSNIKSLKWTKGVPSEDGYYWCRIDKDDPEPLIAKVSAEGRIAYECGCECCIHDLAAYEWYGPLFVEGD